MMWEIAIAAAASLLGSQGTKDREISTPSCNCRNCGAAYEFGDLACRYCKSERVAQVPPVAWATTRPDYLPYLHQPRHQPMDFSYLSSPLPGGAGGELWTATAPTEPGATPVPESFSPGAGGDFGGGGASGDY